MWREYIGKQGSREQFQWDFQGFQVIALVGAGGKTTLLDHLAREGEAGGYNVAVTTTTHLQIPQGGNLAFRAADLHRLWMDGRYAILGTVGEHRLSAPDEALLEAAQEQADLIFVEADGSRRMPCKAPRPFEPALPEDAEAVMAVLGMSAVGKPIREVCFCLDEVTQLLGKSPEEIFTEEDAAKLLSDPNGGRKNAEELPYAAVLNQCDDPRRKESARRIAYLLLQKRVEHVILTCFAQEERNRFEKGFEMNDLIVVRGGGDLATGTVHRLWSAGFRVLILETDAPAAIRRQVCLCEAVYDGEKTVEGLTAVRVSRLSDLEQIWQDGKVPLLIDPAGKSLPALQPAVVVDAILAKRNLGTNRSMAPLTIGLGPGFEAGKDVDVVIETLRGHNLGRVIRTGTAAANTGIPGEIGGVGADRVLRAPCAGVIRTVRSIGDLVQRGTEIARVKTEYGEIPVPATISGILRGLIRDEYPVTAGFKIGDIDPRAEEVGNCFTISDKARALGGSVLEQVCSFLLKRGK